MASVQESCERLQEWVDDQKTGFTGPGPDVHDVEALLALVNGMSNTPLTGMTLFDLWAFCQSAVGHADRDFELPVSVSAHLEFLEPRFGMARPRPVWRITGVSTAFDHDPLEDGDEPGPQPAGQQVAGPESAGQEWVKDGDHYVPSDRPPPWERLKF